MFRKSELALTYVQLIVVAVFWGGTFVAAKTAVTTSHLSTFTVAALRFALASCLLVGIMFVTKEGRPRLTGIEWLRVLFLGLTGIFAYNALFFTGLKYTSSISGSLIVAINPVVTVILSVLFLRERVGPTQVLGIIASLAGVLIVVTKGSLARLWGLEFNRGDLILLGAPICWATYSVMGKQVMNKMSALASTTYACVVGTLMLAPFAFLETSQASWRVQVGWQGWLSIGYLAVFGSVLGFVWWYQGIAKIGPGKASVFINLVPLSNLVFSGIILNEPIVLSQLSGAALVILGVYLSGRSGYPRKLVVEVFK